MCYDVIVVGAGMAGLTSAAFLARSGYSVLLLERLRKWAAASTHSKEMVMFLTAE
jgi:phytoene dehydrogenase-like protein